jgi:micrococcal nuclease
MRLAGPALLALALAVPALAADDRPGLVFRVIDGDSAVIEIPSLPHVGEVRLRGIDAPELHGQCAAERAKAQAAKAKLADLLPTFAQVRVRDVQPDKYFGRYIADVILPDGSSAADAMVAAGLARPYSGGTRQPWC